MPARRAVQSKNETRLGRLRVARGMSQEELAAACGLSLPTYRRLERGRTTNPPYRYLVNLAFVLGCPIEELIEEEWRDWLPIGGQTQPSNPRSLWQPDRYRASGAEPSGEPKRRRGKS